MAIYGINGNQLSKAYSKNGDSANRLYDVSGNSVFQPNLRIMTYNVGQWYVGGGSYAPAEKDAEYYDLQNGILSRNNVDVICLEEYVYYLSALPRTAESMLSQYFPYRHLKEWRQYYGRGICSKYELSDYTENDYTVEPNRYYDKAYITFNGKRIAIFVTHLSTTLSNRVSQLEELMTALQNEEYFICCGDFNTTTINGTATVDTDDYRQIATPLLNAGYHLANWSTEFMYTYNANDWSGCLDNIITSPNITIVSAYVDTTKLTDSITDTVDHMPLIAELQVN